jgi:HlyD family secretion protein
MAQATVTNPETMEATSRRLLIPVIILVAALLIITAIGAGYFFSSNINRSVPSNVAIVHRGDLKAAINASGKIRPKRSARLALPTSGIVDSVNKMEGDEVAEGDVILSLRATEAQRRVKQAELVLQTRQLELARAKGAPRQEDIDIARANVRKATVIAAAAEANFNASQTASNSAGLEAARADLDIARANFNRLANGPTKDELDALQNAVTIASLDLDNAKGSLAQTQVIAPFSGMVTEIDARPEELVGAFTPLSSVADMSALEVIAEIDEIDVANVQVGQDVELRLDAFPAERFAGRVNRIFPAASTQRGSTVYDAVVDIDPRDFKLRPGMGASLKVQTVEKKNVLLVPTRAIKAVGTRKAVHVQSPGVPRDVIVLTGASDGNDTEVVDGLNDGDQVSLQ